MSRSRFPERCIEYYHGLGHKVGDAITRHPDTPIISFTGGTALGFKIAEVAAPMFKKLSLELVVKIQISSLLMLI